MNSFRVENPCGKAPAENPSEPRGTMKTVEHLFATFNYFYGPRWTWHQCDAVTGTGSKRAWLRIVSQMTVRDIMQTMDYVLSPANDQYVEYAPNPLEFCHLLKKIKTTKIPTMDECYNAAIKRDWAFHPIVYPTAKACDIYWLRKQASLYEGRKRFHGHYASQKEKFLRGEALLQPAPKRKQLTAEEAAAEASKKIVGDIRFAISRNAAQFKNLPAYQQFLKADGLRERLTIVRSSGSKKLQENLKWLEGDDDSVNASESA